jgi:hypothetical protein
MTSRSVPADQGLHGRTDGLIATTITNGRPGISRPLLFYGVDDLHMITALATLVAADALKALRCASGDISGAASRLPLISRPREKSNMTDEPNHVGQASSETRLPSKKQPKKKQRRGSSRGSRRDLRADLHPARQRRPRRAARARLAVSELE